MVPPDPGEVHLWHLPFAAGLCPRWELLNPAEQKRVACFRDEEDAARFAAARLSVRTVLAGYLGIPAEEVQIETTPEGKPLLRRALGTKLTFSTSCARERAFLAIARDQRVGVDVADRHTLPDVGSLARHMLHPQEWHAIEMCDEPLRSDLFLRLWTRKEAVVKLLGVGFRIPPESLCVLLDPSGCGRVEVGGKPAPPIHVRDVLDERFIAAFAAESVSVPPLVREFRDGAFPHDS
jgi:4'-phosphopantetheinyl transferase